MVSDSTGRPLPDVLVFIDDGGVATLTDPLGLFVLSPVSFERHAINYRKAGYAPRSFSLDFSTAAEARDLGTVVLVPGSEPTATLSGRVTEGADGPGLAGAVVELNGHVVAVTDTSGMFTARATPVAWGSNDLVVQHRAFSDRTVNDRIWISNADEAFDFVVAFDIVPVALPEVEVDVQSRQLALNGFYERREDISSAIFLTREEIVAKRPRVMQDLFRGILSGAGINRAPTTFGRSDDAWPCQPVYFVDGLQMMRITPIDLNRMMDPDDLEGIEIYETIAGLPPRFSPIGAVCGVIVMWTRQQR